MPSMPYHCPASAQAPYSLLLCVGKEIQKLASKGKKRVWKAIVGSFHKIPQGAK